MNFVKCIKNTLYLYFCFFVFYPLRTRLQLFSRIWAKKQRSVRRKRFSISLLNPKQPSDVQIMLLIDREMTPVR